MKKKIETPSNVSSTMQLVELNALKGMGASRENVTVFKDDTILIPEQIMVWIEEFVPKGSSEKKTYGLIGVEINGRPVAMSMATFRKVGGVANDERDEILANKLNRELWECMDDEYRANFLAGKTLKVIDVKIAKNLNPDRGSVRVPLFELVEG